MSVGALVHIHYRRPPDRIDIFENRLVAQTTDAVVTFMPATRLRESVRVDGVSILDDGAPAVWVTFPGAWHDIGRFHRADGTFTGFYANVLTPVRFVDARTWETTDLFLDVWLGADGTIRLLDEDELAAALRVGALSAETAARAQAEAEQLLALARAGAWPPPIVHEWPLERVLSALGDGGTSPARVG